MEVDLLQLQLELLTVGHLPGKISAGSQPINTSAQHWRALFCCLGDGHAYILCGVQLFLYVHHFFLILVLLKLALAVTEQNLPEGNTVSILSGHIQLGGGDKRRSPVPTGTLTKRTQHSRFPRHRLTPRRWWHILA